MIYPKGLLQVNALLGTCVSTQATTKVVLDYESAMASIVNRGRGVARISAGQAHRTRILISSYLPSDTPCVVWRCQQELHFFWLEEYLQDAGEDGGLNFIRCSSPLRSVRHRMGFNSR